MAKLRTVQTTFQQGQIDDTAIARNDVGLFSQALGNGTNWRMTATGAIERRPGTLYQADLGKEVRLVPFEFDDDEVYIFAFEENLVRMYDSTGTEVDSLVIVLPAAQLWEFGWVQSGDFMFITHKEVKTQEIQRTSVDTFAVSDYAFDLNDLAVRQAPFTKYADVSNTITITKPGTPYILTSSAAHWSASYVGKQVKVWGATTAATDGRWNVFQISAYTSTTVVEATLLDDVSDAPTLPHTATKQWLEEAVNEIWGYASTVAFHAGRLWMGGFKSLPAHIASSKVGLFWNFDVDDGSTEDSIFAPIDSDRVNSVRHIVSGYNLQVFTDLAEMHLSEEEGTPISPATAAIRTNSRYGSNYVRPLVFDDATFFVQNNGGVVREYLWNSLNRGYTSSPLSLLANDIIGTIKQSAIDYGGENGPEQYAYFLNTDGTLAVYHALRSEEGFNGFFKWTTDGEIKSITVSGGSLFACVKRNINSTDEYYLEKFDSSVFMDCAVAKTASPAASSFTGLSEHAGSTVHVTSESNGYYLGEFSVTAAGALDISGPGYTAEQIYVGRNYTATAETLPLNFPLPNGPSDALPKRLVSAMIRVDSSYDFEIQGMAFSPRFISHEISQPPVRYTGLRREYLLGAAFDKTLTVTSDIPLDCTLLSMAMEVGL